MTPLQFVSAIAQAVIQQENRIDTLNLSIYFLSIVLGIVIFCIYKLNKKISLIKDNKD